MAVAGLRSLSWQLPLFICFHLFLQILIVSLALFVFRLVCLCKSALSATNTHTIMTVPQFSSLCSFHISEPKPILRFHSLSHRALIGSVWLWCSTTANQVSPERAYVTNMWLREPEWRAVLRKKGLVGRTYITEVSSITMPTRSLCEPAFRNSRTM